MNWEAIGAIGEVSGAIAVVVTLVYLSIQLKQNSQQIRIASSQTAFNSYSGRMREVLSDPVRLTLFRRGLKDYSALSPDDQAGFHAILVGFQVSYLQNRQLNEEGVIGDETFRNWENDWIRILKCHGSQQWWQWARPMFDSKTAWAIDQLVAGSDQPPLNEAVPFLKTTERTDSG